MSPADLNAFWQRTRDALHTTPINATLTAAPEHSGREYVTYRVMPSPCTGCGAIWGRNGAPSRAGALLTRRCPLRQIEIVELRDVLPHDLPPLLRWNILEITGDNLP